MDQYKPWRNRIRDHASEDWHEWRQILDDVVKVPHEIKLEDLKNVTLCGVNAYTLSLDLWSFMLRWVGPTLYPRRNRIAPHIEGERSGTLAPTVPRI
jgi:hypothetical protein